jgi:hypothetical protein
MRPPTRSAVRRRALRARSSSVLIEVDVTGVDPQAGLAALRAQIVPAITRLPGFRSGKWLTGNESGQGLSLTLWDTAGAANVTAERCGIGSSPQMSATVARCEIREVAATA